MEKKTVMLVLCRRVIAELLVEAIHTRTDVETFAMYEFRQVKNMAMVKKPKLALVEVPERHGSPVDDALAVCREIKEASPGCKIILICPENDTEGVETTSQALREGEIDDFMFYDLSVDYLVAKVGTLLPDD